jgi:hypothetical protein
MLDELLVLKIANSLKGKELLSFCFMDKKIFNMCDGNRNLSRRLRETILFDRELSEMTVKDKVYEVLKSMENNKIGHLKYLLRYKEQSTTKEEIYKNHGYIPIQMYDQIRDNRDFRKAYYNLLDIVVKKNFAEITKLVISDIINFNNSVCDRHHWFSMRELLEKLVSFGDVEAIKLLLGDPKSRVEYDLLFAICGGGNFTSPIDLSPNKQMEIVKLFVDDYGMDINETNVITFNNGHDVHIDHLISVAARKDHSDVVHYILNHPKFKGRRTYVIQDAIRSATGKSRDLLKEHIEDTFPLFQSSSIYDDVDVFMDWRKMQEY